MSMGRYCAKRSRGDTSITAIPVFVLRVFRHSMIYVRADSPLESLEQLAGRRVGVPEWAQTATVYSRSLLTHEAGVPLASIKWFQAGVNDPGRMEKVDVDIPEGVALTRVTDRSLNEMLIAGDLDAVLSARAPAQYGRGIRRLFEQYEPVEEAYYRKTGIYPIMHTIVVRTELLDRHPWLAMNLFVAFEEAKRRSLERLSDATAPHAPLPWIASHTERMRATFGDDLWPYGVEKNRKTLDAFLQFTYEQGVCRRRLAPEELFHPNVSTSYKV
jgi:4,5-dihydroxyphthalate decarboxylase